jgi:hypothetical protein
VYDIVRELDLYERWKLGKIPTGNGVLYCFVSVDLMMNIAQFKLQVMSLSLHRFRYMKRMWRVHKPDNVHSFWRKSDKSSSCHSIIDFHISDFSDVRRRSHSEDLELKFLDEAMKIHSPSAKSTQSIMPLSSSLP